ncbi:MAG: hypothetical protein K1X88_16915, partial [Nannocystaceae bacterium]|nr:hypothetical protein [Nannocystaceae bacterium]
SVAPVLAPAAIAPAPVEAAAPVPVPAAAPVPTAPVEAAPEAPAEPVVIVDDDGSKRPRKKAAPKRDGATKPDAEPRNPDLDAFLPQ